MEKMTLLEDVLDDCRDWRGYNQDSPRETRLLLVSWPQPSPLGSSGAWIALNSHPSLKPVDWALTHLPSVSPSWVWEQLPPDEDNSQRRVQREQLAARSPAFEWNICTPSTWGQCISWKIESIKERYQQRIAYSTACIHICSMEAWNLQLPLAFISDLTLIWLAFCTLCNWDEMRSLSSFITHLVNAYLLQPGLTVLPVPLSFVCIRSLWLADSGSLRKLMHTGGKLGTLREHTNFLMNPESLVENVDSIPMW